MNTRATIAPSQSSASQTPTASRGSVWLRVARAGFVILSIVALVACVASVPSALAQYGTLCMLPDASNCPDGQATLAGAGALHTLGVSLHEYAIYTVSLILMATAVYVGVAALIFWRRSGDWMGLFTATFLLTFGVGANGFIDTLAAQQPAWAPLINSIIAIGNVSIGIFFFTFPNGRFVPRWTIWAAVAWLAQVPGIFTPTLQLPEEVSGLLFVGIVLSMVVATTYRYRRVSSAVERQQTKWVVFAGVLTALTEVGLSLTILWADLTVNASRSALDVLGNTAYILVPMAIPLAIGIAILRYRLWDIDVIINRTLVYGLLTLLLAAVYFGSVIGMQHLAAAVAGPRASDNSLIIVLSTLLIAALFTPLRHRIQRAIDRRFYRAKYDAAKTLAAFASTLRAETDLSALSTHLVAVVDETMRPQHVSLWLRAHEREVRA